jgi:hypothetical protein
MAKLKPAESTAVSASATMPTEKMPRCTRRTVAYTSRRGTARRMTRPPLAGTAMYSSAAPTDVLTRTARPSRPESASRISGRFPWFSNRASCVSGTSESPMTLPSRAMRVTRRPETPPSQSATESGSVARREAWRARASMSSRRRSSACMRVRLRRRVVPTPSVSATTTAVMTTR